MMRLAFRGQLPRMLGASGRRSRGGPTPFTGILPHLSGGPGPPVVTIYVYRLKSIP